MAAWWRRLSVGWQYLLILAGVNFVGNYFYSGEFGLYDDDYYFTLPLFTDSFGDLVESWKLALTTWPQGRPIWWVLNPLQAWLIGQAGGLAAGYTLGFVLSSVTAWIVFRFFRRFVSPGGALVGAIFFVLFPPDTSKMILMHQVAFQVTTMFLIGAMSLYLSGYRAWSYAAAVLILLTFEPYFLPFGFVPLLLWMPWQKMLVRLAVHGLICGVILGGVLALRRLIGDPRMADVLGEPSTVLWRAMVAPLYGMTASAETFVSRLGPVIQTADAVTWAMGVLIAVAIFFAMRWAWRESSGEDRRIGRLLWWSFAGFALATISYVYRFHDWYFPPVMVIGRVSGLHQAAALGFGLCVAGLADGAALIGGSRRNWLGTLGQAVTAGYFSMLVLFGLLVQQTEYVRAWELRTTFFKDVLGELANLRGEDYVLVDLNSVARLPLDERPETAGFGAMAFMSPGTAFEQFAAMPEGWTAANRLRKLDRSVEPTIEGDGVRLNDEMYVGDAPLIRNGNFVLFAYEDGHWRRQAGPLFLENQYFWPRRSPVVDVGGLELTETYEMVFRDELEAGRDSALMADRNAKAKLRREGLPERKKKSNPRPRRKLDLTDAPARPAR